MLAIYENLCPQCKKDLSTEESESGFCSTVNRGLCFLERDYLLSEFSEFFKKTVGNLTSIQKFWANRILSGESFAAVAPTGVGKTTFGLAISVFLASKGKRCYAIFPTSMLAEQSFERITEICQKSGVNLNILFYKSGMKKKEREEFFEKLGKEDVLITTSQFLSKNFNKLKCCYNFIFVDDVDSILKTSKNVERILQLLGFKWDKKTKEWSGESKGVLMVSTATAKKGSKVKLFRKLLGFDVGLTHHTLMNVENIVVEDKSIEILKKILKTMGFGGIIYARSVEEAEKTVENLKSDFKIGLVTGKDKLKNYEMFERGELDYLVGTSYYYGTLVRGLDLPERIRYAVFVGAPTFNVKVEDVDNLSDKMINVIKNILKIESEDKVKEKIKEILESEDILNKINVKDVCLRKGELIFPDIRTYIQGSGRTSRLFSGGITKGATFLLEDDECVRNAFIERSKYFNLEFKKLEEVDLQKLIEEIDESRRKLGKKEVVDLIKPALFIVESPTKAKQISRFFGKPSVKVSNVVSYEVPSMKNILLITASLGHITDLTVNRGFHGVETNGVFIPVYSTIKKCKNCGYQFTGNRNTCPKCGGEVDDSIVRIEALRELAHDASMVIIGTDPDSEGEKIAWDILNLLSGCGDIKRAEFHEITPKAVIGALNNLRKVDENLVKAQVVRRIEDRWIGFVLSQKLWEVFNSKNLSAGRAQTPVLGWIIERYKEHKVKKTVVCFLGISVEGDIAEKIAERLKSERKTKLRIKLIEKKVEERQPLPPYTTDSMLRDANTILKISAAETMRLAQELFESGLITYHRTDSTRVSETGLKIAKEWLGDEFYAREWFAEGAHECIRPTRAMDRDTLARLIQEGVIYAEGITWRHLSLYDLIFRRFMASQCKNYMVEVAKYEIDLMGLKLEEERIVNAKGKAYELYKAVRVKEELLEGEIETEVTVKSVPSKPLLTQSDVIQMMKEKGIGRPSTYSTIIEKLFKRNYIIEKRGKLIPTKRGIEVYNYLAENYAEFVSEERTRKLEEKMDAVESGRVDYLEVLKELYEEISKI